jgi:hypothetical protein
MIEKGWKRYPSMDKMLAGFHQTMNVRVWSQCSIGQLLFSREAKCVTILMQLSRSGSGPLGPVSGANEEISWGL